MNPQYSKNILCTSLLSYTYPPHSSFSAAAAYSMAGAPSPPTCWPPVPDSAPVSSANSASNSSKSPASPSSDSSDGSAPSPVAAAAVAAAGYLHSQHGRGGGRGGRIAGHSHRGRRRRRMPPALRKQRIQLLHIPLLPKVRQRRRRLPRTNVATQSNQIKLLSNRIQMAFRFAFACFKPYTHSP